MEIEVVNPVDDSASVGAEPAPVGDAGAGVAEESPFFTYTGKDGTAHDYKNAGEVADAFTHSSFRKADHDREMEKVSKRGKYLEEQIARYNKSQEELNASDGLKYHKMLQNIQQSNPQGYARLKAEFAANSGVGTPDLERILDEKLKPFIEKQEGYEKAEEGRAAAGRQEAARVRMKERYPDFDDSLIQAELKRISEVPKQDMEFALYELMQNVVQGRTTPAELERRAAEAAARTSKPSVKSTPGAKPTGRDPNDMSPAERREEAVKLLPG